MKTKWYRQYTEPYSAPFSSNFKDSGSARGDWKDNEYSQLTHGSPIVAQTWNNFSLPRSRTIVDVNNDSLVKKPWRHPGADVTDFFNFGFDEESWKHYRNLENKLITIEEKSRDQIMMENRTAVHKLPKHMKDFEAGSGHEEVAQASVAKNTAQSRPKRRVSLASKNYDRDQQSELANGRSNQADDNVGRHQQDLKEDSLNSSMKTVDRTVSQMHETCENGDIAMEDDTGLLHFSRAIEDKTPSLEGNDEGRGKTTSERCIPACDPASLDLDEYGSVQISDSEEDNHYEASVCDSDGISRAMETSDSTIKSYGRNISDKTPSTAEPESSDSGQSRRAPSSSPSHCERLGDDDLGKSRKHSKNLLPNPVSKLRESVTCDYHPTKDPKTHNVKTDFRHNRYFRSKEPIRKDKPYRKSDDPSKLKTHLTDEDGSHVSNAKGISDLHHSTVGHDKLSCTLDNFDSNVRKDTFYCRGSDHFVTYFDGVFPDYQFGPAYMKNRCWNIHPSFGYEPGCYDSRDTNVKRTFIKGKQSKVDNEAVDQDRHHGRKHAVQDIDSRCFEESRHFIPKLPAYMENGGYTQFNWKGDGKQFKRRIKGDKFIPVHNYKKNFVHGKHRRFTPIDDRDCDHVGYKDDQELPYSGRKIKSPGRRGECRYDRPLNGFDNSGRADWVDDDGRCISRRPLSYKEPQARRGGRYQGATGPKSGVPERPGRHMRCSRSERFRESDRFGSYNNAFETDGDIKDLHGQDHFVRKRHYQQSIDAFDTNEGIKNHHNHDHFVRRRHYQQSEVLDWNEEEYTSRQWDDAVFHSKEPSYPFERFSKHINSDATQGSDCVVKIIDKRQVHRRRYKLKRESKRGSQFNQSSNFIHPENCWQTHPRCRDSVEPHLVVSGRKLSRRSSEAGCTTRYGGHNYLDWNSDPEQETPTGLNDFGSEKAALAKTEKPDTNLGDKSWNDKFPDTQQNEYLDIEEGQIISEEINEKSAEREIASEHMTRANSTEHTGIASNGNTVVHGHDDLRIQEIIAKMEKRRERFKDPITSNKDAVKPSNHLKEFDTGTAETRLNRPARKRKWVRN
ncbi:FIP1[III]-like protein [Forsythia ovata]|uniref:FIP1[III]-like protein n=1 Tax=Forsythia ovata TaxID=205694 RepID=A0ABD1V0Y3_9LAMI